MLLHNYLPEFIANTKEFKALFNAVQQEIDTLFDEVEKILIDLFVLNCSEYATKRYENIVGIAPKLTDSLHKRQLDILAIYNEVPPFTYERLQEMLTATLGGNGFKIKLDIPNYRLFIKLHRYNADFVQQVNDMLDRVIPVNIVLDYSIDWNTWEDLSYFTWDNLNNYTWKDARENEDLNSVKWEE